MKTQSDPIGVRRKKSDSGAIRHRIQWFRARSEGRTESPGFHPICQNGEQHQLKNLRMTMIPVSIVQHDDVRTIDTT